MFKRIKNTNCIKKRNETECRQKKRQNNEDNIRAVNRIADTLAGAKQQEQADDDKRAFREKVTIGTMQDARFASDKAHNDNIATLSKAEDAVKAANRSADAATRASNATLGLERPFFHILKVDLLRPNGENDPNPFVDYSFVNAGRTAAIVREMNFDCRLIAPSSLPPTPPYDSSKTGTTRALAVATNYIGSNVPATPLAKCSFREPFTGPDYVDLRDGRKIIIFFGFIKYEGMLNFVYTKGFGVYYDFGRSFFGDINSDAYNYDIKTERPQGAMTHFQ